MDDNEFFEYDVSQYGIYEFKFTEDLNRDVQIVLMSSERGVSILDRMSGSIYHGTARAGHVQFVIEPHTVNFAVKFD